MHEMSCTQTWHWDLLYVKVKLVCYFWLIKYCAPRTWELAHDAFWLRYWWHLKWPSKNVRFVSALWSLNLYSTCTTEFTIQGLLLMPQLLYIKKKDQPKVRKAVLFTDEHGMASRGSFLCTNVWEEHFQYWTTLLQFQLTVTWNNPYYCFEGMTCM